MKTSNILAILAKLRVLVLVITIALTSVTSALADKPKYVGANYTNSKSYVIRNVRYHLKDKQQSKNFKEQGSASWYCCYGKGAKTADGSLYSQHKLTAAHKSLPFGSLVKVTNIRNGKSVTVEINDRGPFSKGRVIDLTPAAFAAIESKSLGLAKVKLEVIGFKY